MAKNVVAAGLADRCEVQVAYAIGVAHPVSVMVETFGTEKIGRAQIAELVDEHFDLRPGAFREELKLHRPIYQKTAAYGHFGRDDHDFTWERTDKADALRDAAGLGAEAPPSSARSRARARPAPAGLRRRAGGERRRRAPLGARERPVAPAAGSAGAVAAGAVRGCALRPVDRRATTFSGCAMPRKVKSESPAPAVSKSTVPICRIALEDAGRC